MTFTLRKSCDVVLVRRIAKLGRFALTRDADIDAACEVYDVLYDYDRARRFRRDVSQEGSREIINAVHTLGVAVEAARAAHNRASTEAFSRGLDAGIEIGRGGGYQLGRSDGYQAGYAEGRRIYGRTA